MKVANFQGNVGIEKSLVKIDKTGMAWQILQHASFIDGDFVGIDILSELCGSKNEKTKEYITHLSQQSLVELVSVNFALGIKIPVIVQDAVKKYMISNQPVSHSENVVFNRLLQILDKLMPTVQRTPEDSWHVAELLIDNIEKLLSQTEKLTTKVAANLHDKLAMYYLNIEQDLTASFEHQKKAIHIRKLFSDKDADLAKSFGQINTILQEMGDLKQGLQYAEKALDMYKSLSADGAKSLELAKSLGNVGVAHYNLGNREKALEYNKLSLEMYLALYRSNSSNGVNSDDNDSNNDYAGANNVLVAHALNRVGGSYMGLGNNIEGLIYLEKALAMYRAIFKEDNHIDIADALSNIGVCHVALGDEKQGFKCQEQALKIFKLVYKTEHSSIAKSINNLAGYYIRAGELKEAVQQYEESLKILKLLHDGNHQDIALVLHNLGMVYNNLNQLDKAVEYCEQALQMRKIVYHGKHPLLTTSLNSLGTIYEKLGQTDKALKYKQDALKMLHELNLGEHPAVSSSLASVGHSYEAIGYHAKASVLCAKAKTVEDKFEKGIEEFGYTEIESNSIIKFGAIDDTTLSVMKKMLKVLNKISELSSNGGWSQKTVASWIDKAISSITDNNTGHDYSVYFSDKYLKSQLGDLASSKNIEIAKMLCFEAMNLGLAMNNQSWDQEISYVQAIAASNPELVKKILSTHPDYFVDGKILKACIMDPVIVAELLGGQIDSYDLETFDVLG